MTDKLLLIGFAKHEFPEKMRALGCNIHNTDLIQETYYKLLYSMAVQLVSLEKRIKKCTVRKRRRKQR